MNEWLFFGILLLISFACGTFWRMGGSDKYDKLWRRIGCTICICVTIPMLYHSVLLEKYILSIALVAWGCCSYFGWINYIVRVFWDDIEMGREYFWNFTIENICIQSSVLPYKNTPMNYIFAAGWGCLTAYIKVKVDDDEDGVIHILWWEVNEAVVSEWLHGFLNCVGVIINFHIG